MELPRRLKEVGQELAFHFSTNPEIYKAFASASAQNGSETGVFEWRSREIDVVFGNTTVQSVREMLLKKETSQGLKEKLVITKH